MIRYNSFIDFYGDSRGFEEIKHKESKFERIDNCKREGG